MTANALDTATSPRDSLQSFRDSIRNCGAIAKDLLPAIFLGRVYDAQISARIEELVVHTDLVFENYRIGNLSFDRGPTDTRLENAYNKIKEAEPVFAAFFKLLSAPIMASELRKAAICSLSSTMVKALAEVAYVASF